MLADVCNVLDSKRIPITRNKRLAGPYPYYGANGIQDYVADYIFDDELVLLAEDGGHFEGGKQIAYRVSGKCWVNNHEHVLKAKKNIDTDYLYFALRCYDVTSLTNGATRKKLTQAAMKRMLLPLRSINDQLYIVNNLKSVETQLESARKQLSKLDGLVKSRFVEMFGSSSADSRYEVCRIGDIADVFVGVVVKPKQYYTDDHANGIKAFRSLNVGEMQVRDDDWVYFSKEGNKKAKKTQLHAGDVLVVRSGYPGTSCVVPLLYEGCNAVDLIIARSNSNNVLPEYIAAFNNGSHMKSLINQMSVGSAQKHFNIGFYRNVEIPLPPLSAQKEYVSFLRQVNKSRFS